MKKVSLVVLAGLLSVSLFAQGAKETAPAASAGGSGEKVKLTFVEVMTAPARTKVIQEMIDEYEKDHPNVEIELVSPPYEQADTKLTMMLNANEPIDIAEVRDHTVMQFVTNGKLTDLTDKLESWDEYDDLSPITIHAAKTVNNTPYLIPEGFYGKGLFVRTDLYKELGYTEEDYPKTVSELYKQCKDVTDPSKNRYGMSFKGKTNIFTIADSVIFNDVPNVDTTNFEKTTDGKFIADNDIAKKGIADYVQSFKDSVPADAINWSFNDQVNGFINGTCVFMIQDPDTVALLDGQLSLDQYATLPMPVGDTTGTAYVNYGFAGFAIPTTSQHPEEAWEFLKWFLNAENNAKFDKASGPLPIHKSTYANDPYFSTSAYNAWSTMLADSETYIPVDYPQGDPKYPGWPQYSNTTWQALLLGTKSLDETVKAWTEYWGF